MQKISNADLEKFSRKLGKMIGSGIPLVKTLKLLAEDDTIAGLNKIAATTAEKVSLGYRFSNALAAFPGVFTAVYLALVTAAENQGRLDHAMVEIADGIAEGTVSVGAGSCELDETVLDSKDNNSKAIEFVNKMLTDAVKEDACGIVLRPEADHVDVCFDKFSTLGCRQKIDKNFYASVIARIKIMSALDVAEKRLPQDGRIMVKIAEKVLDIKTQILPAVFGEQINMMFVRRTDAVVDPELVFPKPDDRERITRFINNIQTGLVVFSGPTGSGKTTTLYTATSMLNNGSRAIISIADVVDYTFCGITHIQNRPWIGLNMLQSTRAALRTSPDVLVLDGLTNEEVASEAFAAASNGVLVLTQMAARNSTDVFRQFKNLKVSSYNLYGGIGGVVFQVLVRRLCPECLREEEYSSSQLSKLGLKGLKKGAYRESAGCEACKMTGYKGRTPLYEFVFPDKKLKDALIGDDNDKIAKAVEKLGDESIRTQLLELVKAKITSPSEAERIISLLNPCQ